MSADPQPFFGWLDYDDAEAERMRAVFGAFDDKETIDSLGLGVIRDSLSDQLFPGISTVQTRARYFFFVPWILKMLEAEGIAPGDFSERLRELEVALIESLRPQAGPNEGVIGYQARRKLKRLPSTVYWNGLFAYRIRLLPLSLREYRSVAGRMRAAQLVPTTNDDGEIVTSARRMWDPNLPEAPKGFPLQQQTLTLPEAHSEYLRDKIVTSQSGSMIAELARDLEIDRDVPTPWDVPIVSPTSQLQALLHHAQCFSELMHGAQVLYNLLLATRAAAELGWDTAELQENLVGDLVEWQELIAERLPVFLKWIDGDEFWICIEDKARVLGRTRRFVADWAELALANPDAIGLESPAVTLVVERERRLKRTLARLTEKRALENWNGEPFSRSQMTFRWSNASRILDDLEFHEGT